MAIAPGMKDMVQDIVSSQDVRSAEVGKLKDEAKKMLHSFQTSHREMGTQLRKDLAQDKAKRRAEVRAMRDGFQTSHKEMSAQLRKSLAQSEAERKKASAELNKELVDYDRGIRREVASLRQETRADLREASGAWHELARTMQAKKTGVKVPPEVKARVEEKAAVPVAEAEVPDLEAKLLAAINEHPNGITLAEVAESLGVAAVVLGRAARRLVDSGKIRREDRTYFPVSAE